MKTFAPPLVPARALDAALATAGHAVIDRSGVEELAALDAKELDALAPFWDRLPLDAHLRDGGSYRRRRHGSYVVDAGRVRAVERRAHWQPVEYNALHGGIERWFEPIEPAMESHRAWTALLAAFGARANALRGARTWFVEAHPFRIDAAAGIGRPTPEGAHRDGVDLVVVALVAREGVKGGETRVFAADGPSGVRFTLEEPWSALVLDDARVVHETTPIQPAEGATASHRDTLVLTYRAGGFQGPSTPRELPGTR